jgi:hypothetical protein
MILDIPFEDVSKIKLALIQNIEHASSGTDAAAIDAAVYALGSYTMALSLAKRGQVCESRPTMVLPVANVLKMFSSN